MLPEQKVEMKWGAKNKNYYVGLKYKFTKFGDIFLVDVNHLTRGSHARIQVVCDLCGKIKPQTYKDYVKIHEKTAVDIDCCVECMPKKYEQSMEKLYGVTNASYLEEVNNKRKEIYYSKSDEEKQAIMQKTKDGLFKNYGVLNPYDSEIIRQKAIETNRRKYNSDWYISSDIGKETVKNSLFEKYGVSYVWDISGVFDKVLATNIERYGTPYPMQNIEVQKRQRQTCKAKYGYEFPAQSPEIMAKMRQTCLELYNCENYTQTNEYKVRTKEICMNKYGYPSAIMHPDIKQKAINAVKEKFGVDNVFKLEEFQEKARRSLYENGTTPTSVLQKYVYNLLGGELNYPVKTSSLDICDLDELIYIEVDGSGHNIQVQRGNITQEQFDKKEMRRWYALYNQGWKEIRIISKKDRLPSDEIVLQMIQYAKEYFQTGHSWMRFDIDNSIVYCHQFEKEYDYGTLRWIKKFHVERQEQVISITNTI